MSTPRPPNSPCDPLGPHFGAQVEGLDLATADDEELAAVRAALVERQGALLLRPDP